jgi:hypothetical protein
MADRVFLVLGVAIAELVMKRSPLVSAPELEQLRHKSGTKTNTIAVILFISAVDRERG